MKFNQKMQGRRVWSRKCKGYYTMPLSLKLCNNLNAQPYMLFQEIKSSVFLKMSMLPYLSMDRSPQNKFDLCH